MMTHVVHAVYKMPDIYQLLRVKLVIVLTSLRTQIFSIRE